MLERIKPNPGVTEFFLWDIEELTFLIILGVINHG